MCFSKYAFPAFGYLYSPPQEYRQGISIKKMAKRYFRHFSIDRRYSGLLHPVCCIPWSRQGRSVRARLRWGEIACVRPGCGHRRMARIAV